MDPSSARAALRISCVQMITKCDTDTGRVAIRALAHRSPYTARMHARTIRIFTPSCARATKEVFMAPDGAQMAT